ncbi:hypothetical protein [Fodinibius salsisoli]|uniref:Uncharacterized protein n=1 Tax=Fodinibius salsisoli TaxID=2820877 RepID=A0ABT3PJD5_9BACT|nr:hypothetical protein [Fodinibius salsisoli]MCW9706019.1 hypothetical protein [Fodinibius salsisoli]
MSNRMSVAFVGGGGRWLVEAAKAETSDFWEAKWELGDRNDPDQPLPDVPTLKVWLKQQLQEISAFAYKYEYANFGKCFDRGIKALTESPSAAADGYKIFPDTYGSPAHHQLLNACRSAWVFGGMGSWNDVVFADDEVYAEYEELSDALFNLINLGLAVSATQILIQTPNHQTRLNDVNKGANRTTPTDSQPDIWRGPVRKVAHFNRSGV